MTNDMERVKILTRIKEAEAAVNKMKSDCDSECRKTIADAETEAKDIISASEEKQRHSREEALETFRKEIAGKKAAIFAKGEEDARALIERTGKKLDEATQFIVSEFERSFDV